MVLAIALIISMNLRTIQTQNALLTHKKSMLTMHIMN